MSEMSKIPSNERYFCKKCKSFKGINQFIYQKGRCCNNHLEECTKENHRKFAFENLFKTEIKKPKIEVLEEKKTDNIERIQKIENRLCRMENYFSEEYMARVVSPIIADNVRESINSFFESDIAKYFIIEMKKNTEKQLKDILRNEILKTFIHDQLRDFVYSKSTDLIKATVEKYNFNIRSRLTSDLRTIKQLSYSIDEEIKNVTKNISARSEEIALHRINEVLSKNNTQGLLKIGFEETHYD